MKNYEKIIDITPLVRKGMAAYPKNTPFSSRPLTPFNSEIKLGAHTGAHVDAPRHAFKGGIGVDKIPLAKFVGPCRVLDMARVKKLISASDLKRENIKRGDRILVKTRNSRRGYGKFHSDYVYLGSDGAKYLADAGIALFGIDYLSVKQRGSADNRPHTELLRKRIVIFEGLCLAKVKPGNYFFIGLPLKLSGLDAAPARAMLIKL